MYKQLLIEYIEFSNRWRIPKNYVTFALYKFCWAS